MKAPAAARRGPRVCRRRDGARARPRTARSRRPSSTVFRTSRQLQRAGRSLTSASSDGAGVDQRFVYDRTRRPSHPAEQERRSRPSTGQTSSWCTRTASARRPGCRDQEPARRGPALALMLRLSATHTRVSFRYAQNHHHARRGLARWPRAGRADLLSAWVADAIRTQGAGAC